MSSKCIFLCVLFFHRKGKKPILILRTQLSVRVHSILGNYFSFLTLCFSTSRSVCALPFAAEWWLRGKAVVTVSDVLLNAKVLLPDSTLLQAGMTAVVGISINKQHNLTRKIKLGKPLLLLLFLSFPVFFFPNGISVVKSVLWYREGLLSRSHCYVTAVLQKHCGYTSSRNDCEYGVVEYCYNNMAHPSPIMAQLSFPLPS